MTEKRSARLRRGRYKKIFILVWRAPNPLPSVLLVWSLLTSTNGSFFASVKGHSQTFKNRKPGHTPGNVKLLLPPRQSRGISHLVSILPASATRYIPPIAVDFCPIYTSYFGQSHHLSEICSVIRTNGSPWTISRCPLDHPGSHCRDASERVDSCRFPRSGPTGGSR